VPSDSFEPKFANLEESPWVISSANRSLKSGLIELHRARGVFYALVKRELKSRYRGSLLGFGWALGKPISMLVVFSLIIGEILGASRSIEYFALYLFVGLMFWGFFAEAVVSATNSVVLTGGLVQKVAFPREILPITSVVTAGVNTLIQAPVLILGYLIFGKLPHFEKFLLLIPILAILIFLTLALALLLSSINVYVRDVQPLTELVVTLLMYTTPIMFSWTFVKTKSVEVFGNTTIFDLYVHNPLATVIIGVQDVLWPGQRIYSDGQVASDLFTFTSPVIWVMLIGSVLFAAFSYRVFLKLEPNFAREL
jgi:ABC-2 type transport system permease protein